MFKTKFLALLISLLAVFVFSIALGAVFVPPLEIIKVISGHFTTLGSSTGNDEFDAIIWFVRLPRALTAALAGAALATAGAFMQGIFRNPMADPGIIGVSSGASLGAVICIALNLSAINIMFMPLTAALGALLASMAVITIARQGNKLPALRLLLSGVATSMFFGAITYIVLMNIAGDKVKQFMFWTTGNFNTAVWSNVWIVTIPTLLLLTMSYPLLRDLNLLLAGDAQARTLGINPNKTRMLFMLLASCIAASAVCVGGNISFVGLIVPHIARYFTGSDFRRVIPFAAVGGAMMLLLCDLLARTIFNDLSVGIVTSLIGVPYFIALLRRT